MRGAPREPSSAPPSARLQGSRWGSVAGCRRCRELAPSASRRGSCSFRERQLPDDSWRSRPLVLPFPALEPVGLILGFEDNPVDRDTQLPHRSEEQTSELQSLMRISYAVFCLQKKKQTI